MVLTGFNPLISASWIQRLVVMFTMSIPQMSFQSANKRVLDSEGWRSSSWIPPVGRFNPLISASWIQRVAM